MERSASSVRDPAGEHRRAASAYLLWPLALANIVREDKTETIWSRIHARQALVFGALTSAVVIGTLALPLATVIAIPAVSTAATIGIYSAGLALDAVVIAAAVGLAIRYCSRAARGELFAIPLITPLVDWMFHIRQR